MDFYTQIFKIFRESKKMTLEDVGKAIGVTKPTVQKWEAGKVTPRPERVQQLAELFNCSVQDLSDLKPEGWLIDHYEKMDADNISAIESFRSGLISKIIMLQIDPAAKDIVLQTIQSYKGE